jgi:hypothetical protein
MRTRAAWAAVAGCHEHGFSKSKACAHADKPLPTRCTDERGQAKCKEAAWWVTEAASRELRWDRAPPLGGDLLTFESAIVECPDAPRRAQHTRGGASAHPIRMQLGGGWFPERHVWFSLTSEPAIRFAASDDCSRCLKKETISPGNLPKCSEAAGGYLAAS